MLERLICTTGNLLDGLFQAQYHSGWLWLINIPPIKRRKKNHFTVFLFEFTPTPTPCRGGMGFHCGGQGTFWQSLWQQGTSPGRPQRIGYTSGMSPSRPLHFEDDCRHPWPHPLFLGCRGCREHITHPGIQGMSNSNPVEDKCAAALHLSSSSYAMQVASYIS